MSWLNKVWNTVKPDLSPHPVDVDEPTDHSDKGLGRVYRQDLRSLNFLVRTQIEAASLGKPRSYTWNVPLRLDQGPDGACVGFGYSHELSGTPQRVLGIDYNFAMALYYDIQRIDPWPGGAYPQAEEFYEGTSVLSGAQLLKDRGFYTAYHWALTAREVAEGIAYKGPAVLGLNWHAGMFEPDADGFLSDTGPVLGGHCVVANGITIVYKRRATAFFWRNRTWDDVDWERSYVTITNSWGPDWGDYGTAKIRLANLAGLLSRQGEACFPTRSGKITV